MTIYLLVAVPGEKPSVQPFADRGAATGALNDLEDLVRPSAAVVEGPNDLSTFTSKGLVQIFNGLLPEGAKQVKKFETTEVALKRVFAKIVESGKGLSSPADVTASGNEQETTGEQPQTETTGAEPPKEKDDKAMATKTKKAAKKKAAAKKAPAKRESAPAYVELNGTQPKADMTIGCYIRSLVMQDKHTTTKIVELAKKHFPDNSPAASDVSWNRGELKRRGETVPDVIREKKAAE